RQPADQRSALHRRAQRSGCAQCRRRGSHRDRRPSAVGVARPEAGAGARRSSGTSAADAVSESARPMVCEVRMSMAEKRGRAQCPPPGADGADAYCIPPLALLYVKVLFDPLVEYDVPLNVGWAPPLLPVMLIFTVLDSAKPGRLGSLQPVSVQLR